MIIIKITNKDLNGLSTEEPTYNNFKIRTNNSKIIPTISNGSISDNIRSAFFIINIFKDLIEPLIIASSTKNKKLICEIHKHDNISFEFISEQCQLNDIIQGAHRNTLYSFQKSGTKLKVFNALYLGRHCILNKNMIDDPDVIGICDVAESKIEYQNAVIRLFKKEFILSQDRFDSLKKYDSKLNAEKIMKVMS